MFRTNKPKAEQVEFSQMLSELIENAPKGVHVMCFINTDLPCSGALSNYVLKGSLQRAVGCMAALATKKPMIKKIFKSILKNKPMGRKPHLKTYKKFCKKVFEGRKFIPLTEFNQYIEKEINPNTTYYRNRMETLGLISVQYGVVKLINQ